MALPRVSAIATFFLAAVSILWTVPLDTPILVPASSCVRSSRSHSFKASSSSRIRDIRFTSVIGTPVGLNAFPLNVHRQCRDFLFLGDITLLFYYVHMHKKYQGRPFLSRAVFSRAEFFRRVLLSKIGF